jgi:hypothetical protein
MTKLKNGSESAFPAENGMFKYLGMDKRFYAAVQMMAALVSRTNGSYETLAKQAFILADELLEEEEKDNQ